MLNSPSHQRRCVLIAAGIALAVSLAGVNAYLGGGGDNAGYIAQARSLLEAGERREIYLHDAPAVKMYPPLFPVLLAGVMSIAGQSVLAMKLIVVLCAALCVLAAGFCVVANPEEKDPAETFVRSLPLAGLLAIWFGFSPTLMRYSHDVLSDVPFTAAALAACAFVIRFVRNGGTWSLIWVAVALLVASQIRTAELILNGALLVYAIVEALADRTHRRRMLALILVLASVIAIVLVLSMLRETQYFGQLRGVGTGLQEEPLVTRIMRVGLYYFIMLPVELLGYPDLGPETAVYALAVLCNMLVGIGAVASFRRGQRAPAIILFVYLAGLCTYPYVDRRYYLPVIPFYMWLTAVGGYTAITKLWAVRPFLGSASVAAAVLFPVVSILGLCLQFQNPDIIGTTVVEWVAGFFIIIVLCAWLSRCKLEDAFARRAFALLASVLLGLLLVRALLEEIIPERTRGPAPLSNGYGDLYEASIWLKDHAAKDDLVVSSKPSLVWFWSSGVRGIPIPLGGESEKIASAHWAIIDAIPEDRVAWKFLVPLLQKEARHWAPVWERGGTTVLVRMEPPK